MTDDRSLERAARAWLEVGPTKAPDRAVEAALLQIQTTSQERDLRIPWRLPTMITSSRLAVAAIVGVLVVGGVLLYVGRPGANGVGGEPVPSGSPYAKPSASLAPSPSTTTVVIPPMTETFTSTRHGYAIRYPSGWSATPATKRWTGRDGPDPTAANMDKLRGPNVQLVIASAPLGKQTADQWKAAYVARFGQDGVGVCDVLPPGWPPMTIGGRPGFLDGNDCPGDGSVAPNDRFDEALAFVDGRVYLFWIQGTVDPAYFQAILNSVTFDAAAANDKP